MAEPRLPVARAGLLLTAAALVLGGCATLAPSAYPTPQVRPVVTPTAFSPDGFTHAERIALRVWSPSCEAYRNGSAWMLDATHAVTNRHVVEGASSLSVTDYQGVEYAVSEAAMSRTDDLALLTIDGELPRAATIAPDPPNPGEGVSMSGFTGGGPLETLTGAFVETRDDALNAEGAPVYFVSIAAREGDSGSALVDSNGEVVGVVYAADGGEYAGAVSLERLRAFLDNPEDREPVTASC